MKKIILILLCVITLLPLIACGDKKEKEVKTKTVVEEKIEKKTIYKKYNLGGKPPLTELKVTDTDGNVWFTAEDITEIGLRYHQKTGRYIEIVLNDSVKGKLDEAVNINKTKFELYLSDELVARLKINKEKDGERELIYPDKKEPIMNCFNKIT